MLMAIIITNSSSLKLDDKNTNTQPKAKPKPAKAVWSLARVIAYKLMAKPAKVIAHVSMRCPASIKPTQPISINTTLRPCRLPSKCRPAPPAQAKPMPMKITVVKRMAVNSLISQGEKAACNKPPIHTYKGGCSTYTCPATSGTHTFPPAKTDCMAAYKTGSLGFHKSW